MKNRYIYIFIILGTSLIYANDRDEPFKGMKADFGLLTNTIGLTAQAESRKVPSLLTNINPSFRWTSVFKGFVQGTNIGNPDILSGFTVGYGTKIPLGHEHFYLGIDATIGGGSAWIGRKIDVGVRNYDIIPSAMMSNALYLGIDIKISEGEYFVFKVGVNNMLATLEDEMYVGFPIMISCGFDQFDFKKLK